MTTDIVQLHAARLAACARRPLPRSMGALVNDAACRAPDLPICTFFEAGDTLTRRALDRLSNRFANGLRAIGIGRGHRVGVMLPNVREYPITWIALVKLGAAMVPINPRYTPRELQFALTDAGCAALVIDAAHLPMLTLIGAPDRIIVRGRPDWPGARAWQALCDGGSDAMQEDPNVTADSIANVQYTSGTTGFPKGCLLPQRYWLQIGRATECWHDPAALGPIRRMLVQNPFHYMNCQWLLMAALETDATLFVAPGPSASRFLPWIKQHGIEWCVFPEIVLKQPPADDDATTRLKLACLAAVGPEAQVEIGRRFRVPAREIYGMTEIGGAIAMPVACAEMDGRGSIGLPMLGRDCTTRDPDGAALPTGDVGELWVRGPGMLVGYHGRPDADAESFRDGWFRTGDLARIDDRGFYWIVGRTKDMIRRSGENVAAREVEAVLAASPIVVEAAVIGVADPDRGEEVKAVVALAPGVAASGATVAALRAHCGTGLAAFKVPRYWAFVAELPRTPSNKIEKAKLRAEGEPGTDTYDSAIGIWLSGA